MSLTMITCITIHPLSRIPWIITNNEENGFFLKTKYAAIKFRSPLTMSNTIPGIKYELNGESFRYETLIPILYPDGSIINNTPATVALIAVRSSREIEVNRKYRLKEEPI